MIEMVTVVPNEIASELVKTGKLYEYNTLKQVNDLTMSIIKSIMVDRIGYPTLPTACLSRVSSGSSGQFIDSSSVLNIIPGNLHDSVIIKLEMPEDMVLSIKFSELLDIASEAENVDPDDDIEREAIEERLNDSLVLGCDDESEDIISFIPFLPQERCRGYVSLNNKIPELENAGIQKGDFRQLTSFL